MHPTMHLLPSICHTTLLSHLSLNTIHRVNINILTSFSPPPPSHPKLASLFITFSVLFLFSIPSQTCITASHSQYSPSHLKPASLHHILSILHHIPITSSHKSSFPPHYWYPPSHLSLHHITTTPHHTPTLYNIPTSVPSPLPCIP